MSTSSDESKRNHRIQFVEEQDIRPATRMHTVGPGNQTSAGQEARQSVISIPDSEEDVEQWEVRKSRILQCADEFRNRINLRSASESRSQEWPGDLYLASPVLDFPIEGAESEALVHWVYFYANRPILSSLWVTEVPKRKERLLSFIKADVLASQQAVFGLIPGDIAISEVETAAIALFAANGHKACRLFGGLPTSLAHKENWLADDGRPLLGAKVVRFLFYLAARQFWPRHMNIFCEHLSHYSDPWERADAALEWSDRVRRGESFPEKCSFSESRFLEWFDLVSAPEHMAAERDNFGRAWADAVQFARKEEPLKIN
jgi:hypothetical protein